MKEMFYPNSISFFLTRIALKTILFNLVASWAPVGDSDKEVNELEVYLIFINLQILLEHSSI